MKYKVIVLSDVVPLPEKHEISAAVIIEESKKILMSLNRFVAM
jgi:hypothetical protein